MNKIELNWTWVGLRRGEESFSCYNQKPSYFSSSLKADRSRFRFSSFLFVLGHKCLSSPLEFSFQPPVLFFLLPSRHYLEKAIQTAQFLTLFISLFLRFHLMRREHELCFLWRNLTVSKHSQSSFVQVNYYYYCYCSCQRNLQRCPVPHYFGNL